MLTRTTQLFACLVLLAQSGCAIHTPFQVVRYWADWNTERQLNAQVEIFDHLPPKMGRVKLTRWGYNVGPESVSNTGTFGIGTGVWADRLMFWRRDEVDTNELIVDPAVPPQPPLAPGEFPPDMPLPNAAPQLPPPAPPAEPMESENNRSDLRPDNFSADRTSPQIAPVGYSADAETPTRRATSSAWMFTAPKSTRR